MLVIYYYGFFLKDYTNRNVIRVDVNNYTYEDVLMFSKDLEQQRHTLYVQFDKQFIDNLLEKNFNDVVFVYPSKDIKNEWLIRLQNENESLFRYVESKFDEDIDINSQTFSIGYTIYDENKNIYQIHSRMHLGEKTSKFDNVTLWLLSNSTYLILAWHF